MSDEVRLIRAVLGPVCSSDDDAIKVLQRALELEVDPLVHLAYRFGMGERLVMERAAAWAGLAFSANVPDATAKALEPNRIDTLATIRTLRAESASGEVLYTAPNFAEMIRLRTYFSRDLTLQRQLCVAPSAAIRDALAAGASEALLDEARHRLSRRWPRATAHLELTLLIRIVFVAALLGAVGLAAMAPFWLQPIALPFTGILVVLPSMLRIVAAFSGVEPVGAPKEALVDDADLPVYTILIPLRDEAHMVPLLKRAMHALDYPGEKLDINFVVEGKCASTVAAVMALPDDLGSGLSSSQTASHAPNPRPSTLPCHSRVVSTLSSMTPRIFPTRASFGSPRHALRPIPASNACRPNS